MKSLKTRIIFVILAVISIITSFAVYPVFATTYGQGYYGECLYSANSDTCDISISNNGFTLFLNVTPSSNGSCTIQSDQVTVTTYDPNGYTLTLANESTDTSLLDTDGSNHAIVASSGTPASPQPLVDDWGYRVDGWSNFGAGPTSAETNAPANASLTFAGTQPSSGTADIIAQTTSAPDPFTPITTTVWYGICADNNLNEPSGSYTSTVEYTATAN